MSDQAEQKRRAAKAIRGERRVRFANAVVFAGVVYASIAFGFTLLCFWGHPGQLAVAFFLGLASAGIGFVVGFLFGVPKLASAEIGGAAAQTMSTAERLLFNNNLGQISDWFTKIVVGLGIAQFGEVIDGAEELAVRLRTVFANDRLSETAAGAFGLTLVIAAASISFLLMYMWTATRLVGVWNEQDGATAH